MITSIEALNAIRTALASGDSKNIVNLAQEAQTHDPDDVDASLEIAILLRDYGHFNQSAEICTRILRRHHHHVAALYELATLEAMRGRHVDAILSLERILSVYPCDERSLLFAARMSARLGDPTSAHAYLRSVDEIRPGHPDIVWLRELASFMAAYPATLADRLTQIYERDEHYVSAETIAGWAAASIVKKEGFSLIRLGDGEGAFCCISAEDESKYPHIYDFCRRDRARVWFNNEIDIDSSGFTQTAFTLRNAIQNANVVGLPYRTWVEHEYKYCSPTGIVGLVNALRVAGLPSIKGSQSWATQLVHMDLLQQGILEKLIREQKKVSLISCMPTASGALKEYFELEDVRLYQIPGEKLHTAQLGDETSIGRHYPDRFNDLMRELEKPLHGELFLVAGGILGKLYCNRIKQSGGVALDIGSVVDNWMGKATRPDIDPKYMIKLNM